MLSETVSDKLIGDSRCTENNIFFCALISQLIVMNRDKE